MFLLNDSLLKIILSQYLHGSHSSSGPTLREMFKWNMQKYSWLLSHEYTIHVDSAFFATLI